MHLIIISSGAIQAVNNLDYLAPSTTIQSLLFTLCVSREIPPPAIADQLKHVGFIAYFSGLSGK